MATMLDSDSRRLYSWLWDSHISPKNSKWLQENLKDMDAKVKAMIKLLEEDADSFARRAEMYYKKRPELMKFVEEFYRAYRALAERFDYTTGELRHAQRTLAAAFPNQLPLGLAGDSLSSVTGAESYTPEMPHPIHTFFDPDDEKNEALGLRQFHYTCLEGEVNKDEPRDMDEKDEKHVVQLSSENHDLKAKILTESEHADKAEYEIQTLKKTLADMLGEKESLVSQYQQSLEKCSNADGELNCALKESRRLIENASKTEKEIQMLKEALCMLQAEKDAGLIQQNDYLDMISNLKVKILHAQEEAQRVGKQAVEAEAEAQDLRTKLSRLESENEAGVLQYRRCLDRISDLEKKIKITEEEAEMLREQAARAEVEVEKLRATVSELNEGKEALRVLYEQCLEKIFKLELDLSSAQGDVKRLNSEILTRTKKLQNAEEICVRLEMSNQSLKLEANNLAKKITLKDQELCEKHEELEKIQTCMGDEHMRYVQVEATLQNLQTLHAQSQENQRALSLELKNSLNMFKDLELRKYGLEEEMQQVKHENRSLNELNVSSAVSLKNMESEILGLSQMKERLEEEVARQLGQNTDLQQQILGLKEEIKGLSSSYQAIMSQVELAGLNPETLSLAVKGLQDENSRLRQMYEKDRDDKEAVPEKMEYIKELLEKKNDLESLLANSNFELEESRGKVEELQSSCQSLHGEKSALVLEKALLFCQLQIVTVNMQKLMEENTVLENSLFRANVEVEGLREKARGLEELCQLLKNEKSNLVTERSMLAFRLESVERRLETLAKRFTQFEERYAGHEKEKEVINSHVQELRVSLSMEKQERQSFTVWNQTRLTDLENDIHLLQEENKWKKKEFQEELDKAVMAQFEIFILKKFIEDMEERNYSLLVECEKHIEASKLADKLISELETENLEQQVEEELLLVEIENLRLGIYQVFLALEIGSDVKSDGNVEDVQISIDDILSNVEDMKRFLLKYEDEKQQLLVENDIIVTLLQQVQMEVEELELDRTILGNKYETMMVDFLKTKNEKLELVEMNKQLRLEVIKGDDRASIRRGELESLHVKQDQLQYAYMELQEEHSQAIQKNKTLLQDFSRLKEDYCLVLEETNSMVLETLALDIVSTIFKCFSAEKTTDLKFLSENLRSLHGFNNDLEKELIVLREKLEMTEKENLIMKGTIEQLDLKLKDTDHMNLELSLAIEGMKRKSEESEAELETLKKLTVKLSDDNANLTKEMECLRGVNGNLGMELDMLCGEIEERRMTEKKLTSELQERENEFELWEAEATSFYFDLQISNIRDVLFEDKFHELTGVCETLEGETASKNLEIEEKENKVSVMESEIRELRAQLFAYTPVVDSLKESIASLEHKSLTLAKLIIADNRKPKGVEVAVRSHYDTSDRELMAQKSHLPNGISDLMELQTRVMAVEKVMVEDINRLAGCKSSSSRVKLKSSKGVTEQSRGSYHEDRNMIKEQLHGNGYLMIRNLNLTKAKPEISEVRKGVLIRDIPLDQASNGSSSVYVRSSSRRGHLQNDNQIQMIEQRETAQEGRKIGETGKKSKSMLPYEPQVDDLGVDKLEVPASTIVAYQDGNKGKFLQRLASDAKKLENLQTTVKDLMNRLETSEKSKKAKGVDFGTMKEQLQEVEETILQLVNVNGELMGYIEKSPFLPDGTASAEQQQAWKGSERIGRLQLEVQKIQYVLLKLDDEKKTKGKNRFLRTKTRTSILLRSFIHHGRRSSGGRKKTRLCGCFTPTNGDSNRM